MLTSPARVTVGVVSPASRRRLTDRDLRQLYRRHALHRVARAVCHAGCLPRKELTRRGRWRTRAALFRGGASRPGRRTPPLARGAAARRSSPTALVVTGLTPRGKGHDACQAWTRLSGRVTLSRRPETASIRHPRRRRRACLRGITERARWAVSARARSRCAVMPQSQPGDRGPWRLGRRPPPRHRTGDASRAAGAINMEQAFPPTSRRRTAFARCPVSVVQ